MEKKREEELLGTQLRRARGIPTQKGEAELARNVAEREALEEKIRRQEDDLLALGTINPEESENSPESNRLEREKEGIIKVEDIRHARQIFEEYKAGKKMFDLHVIEDEEWWRQRHWNILNAKDGAVGTEKERGDIDAKSAWLFSMIHARHSDFMDSVPTFAVLPRERNDEHAAKILSSVLPVIFEQNDFEEKYSEASLAKCKHGTGAYGVFWNGSLKNGMGDIVIEDIDVLRLFWQPNVRKLQDSENLFYVVTLTLTAAKAAYPTYADKINSTTANVEEYYDDDYKNRADNVDVIEWYYKKQGQLHYVKFIGDVIIAATENEPDVYPNGLYAHGQYPFFIDKYFSMQSSPAGFGLIDVNKSDQEQIDRLSRALIHNVLGSSQVKTFLSESAGVNADDLADPTKDIIRFVGQLDDANFRTVQPNSNADVYMNVISQKVAQMKETSGNTDVSSGNVPSSVTAASAIAALQEQAGKTVRNAIKQSYRVYARICKCVIALIQEFYDEPRTFRIIGEDGENEYVTISKRDLLASSQVKKLDGTLVDVIPEYDVVVSAQKASSYSSMAQNELGLQFYNAAFFDPARADQAIAALEMMDFRDKDKLIQKISKNGTLYEMVKVLSQRLAAAEKMIGITPNTAVGGQGIAATRKAEMPSTNAEGVVSEEPANVKKARERTAAATQPR